MIALKGNQKKLRERLLAEIEGVKAYSVHSYKQKSHGRNICYRVKVWSVSSEERWAGLRSVVSVHRRGNRGKKQVDSVSYYISSDVIFKEDSCQISKKPTALVMGVLRSIGLNLLRFAGVDSVTEGIMKMGANVEGLLRLMSPCSPSNKVFA